MLSIPVFALAYLFKGGQFNRLLNKLPKFISGKLVAGIIVFLFCSGVTGDRIHGLIFLSAWLLAVSPSMGEEAGAVGRWGYAWGDYIEKGFGRMYGIQKAIQRGAWMGAIFVVAGATILSIPIMALGFPLAHFIGQEIYWRLFKKDDWCYSEFIVGALLGLCYGV